jgi:hypothetical protein
MEYLIQRKIPNDLQKSIVDVFNKLTISGKYHLVGSSSLKSILYNSDYDLNEIVKSKGFGAYHHIATLFQEKFSEAHKNPNYFILDFKCGERHGKPLRWNYKEIQDGYKMVNGKKLDLVMALSEKSRIKLDMIVLIQGVFTEFSEIYYININGHTNDMHYTNTSSLEEDYEEFHKEGDYWKALKRYFSLCRLEPSKNLSKIKKLVEFFNGQVGLLNKNKNELDIILNVLNCDKKPHMYDIVNNLQIVKQSLSNVFAFRLRDNVSYELDELCLHFNKKKLESLRNYLEKIVNDLSLAFSKKI